MPPEKRLGGKEESRTERAPARQPAAGEEVKKGYAELKNEKSNQMPDIGDNPIREKFGNLYDEHEEPRSVIAEGGVVKFELKIGLKNACVGRERFFGVVVEVIFVPTLAVIVDGEGRKEETESEEDEEGNIFFFYRFHFSPLALFILRRGFHSV
jgi:hypothetical protein